MTKPLPAGPFSVIYADPPWAFKTHSAKGLDGRPQHYPRMKLSDIKALPVRDITAADAHLFLWTTGPHMPQALEVMAAWGFKYSGMGFTWIKLNPKATSLFFTARDLFMGGGYTTRKNAEFCLLGRKGKPKRLRKDIHEVIISPRRAHSQKPEEFAERIERYAAGPHLEMFARRQREGWQVWGNDTDKFPAIGVDNSIAID